MSRKITDVERQMLEDLEKRNRTIEQKGWNFLYAEWPHNNKRYRLKARPDVFCDVTRNVDMGSVLVGTWKWVGPDGKQGGPHLTVKDCHREMNRAFSLGQPVNPSTFWQSVPRVAGAPHLKLVP
jgi:hypothetical protein